MGDFHFYQVIIGTEILLKRREDRHFDFLASVLLERGESLYASFVIADEKPLIANIFSLIKNDPKGVMFSFGGIGSTPDDLTRAIAAEVFTHKSLTTHEEAKRRILEQFGDAAYPHRIHMADLPEGAELLDNPINNVPGFSLERRYFFVPGFVQMAYPMVLQALEMLLPQKRALFEATFTALTSENDLIEIMQHIPPTVALSSLPAFCGDKRIAVIRLSSRSEALVDEWKKRFIDYMARKKIDWLYGDRHDDPTLCDNHA